MTRIPLTVYLTILAGIIVVFNHCASSETGDVALNKVTGAAGRFYALFQDVVTTLHHSCTSHLETALCGPTLRGFLSHDARLRYCHAQSSESKSGTLHRREPDAGFGSSDFAFTYYRPRTQLLDSWTSTGDLFRRNRGSLDNHPLSRAVWDWSSEAVVTIGAFLLRVWASWWWFTAPVKVTCVLFVVHSVVFGVNYIFGTSAVLQFISQIYMTVAIEFLQCIQWEAQRHAWDIGIVVMARVYDNVSP